MNSKIVVLSTVNFKHMTVLNLYTDFLDNMQIKYDVIYIDKYGEFEDTNAENIYPYKLSIKKEWNFFRKLLKYIKFRKHAKNIIKKNKYDLVIVWNSFTALMFVDFLIFKFKNRFILNIRDYNYEKIPLIYLLMKKIIRNSRFTTISSDGFKSFLPKHDYINIHSINENLLKNVSPRNNINEKSSPIKITFIGYVRFFENDKKIIDLLGNDDRFIIQFFGEGSEKLNEYAKSNRYFNVFCRGRFESSKTSEFLNKTDVINNLYGYGKIELDTAISIKSFYAAYLQIPILVFDNTYMAKATKGFNYVCNLNSNTFADDLYEWYQNIDFKMLKLSCQKYIDQAKQDNIKFINKLKKTIFES